MLQRDEKEQHFTGTVRLQGPVHVDKSFGCVTVNHINVTQLANGLANKTSNNVINGNSFSLFFQSELFGNLISIWLVKKGSMKYAAPLLVQDIHADSINGINVEDVLSISGHQTILAALNVDVLHVRGNLDCANVNGVDVSDFLYTDEHDQTVLGRIQFSSDVVMQHLVMENGTVNAQDVISLLNPPNLRIDSLVQVTGDWIMDEGEMDLLNSVNLKDLRNRFWTKSTNQTIGNNVRMPFDVIVQGNIATRAFQGRPLNSDHFYLTAANATVSSPVVFHNDVVVVGNMAVDRLEKIVGDISLQDFADGVALTDGKFLMTGTKVGDP